MVMFSMTDGQYQLVYNVLSFSLASMMATTLFLWIRVPAIVPRYQSAVLISGLVTFIAAYHYMRIFNSWTEAYKYPTAHGAAGGQWPAKGDYPNPELTGVPFNDAYRYMDWLLTVPLLLIEIVLTMKMSPDETSKQCKQLGVASAAMICFGYPGELIVEGNLQARWQYWAMAMVPFLFVVYTLLVGLADATNREDDPEVKGLIKRAQMWTVVSWLTYPFVYVTPMMGMGGAQSVVNIQCGYCVSDIISKCGVGLLIYQITSAKSANERKYALNA
jgi:bacteriorhodopsin